MVYRFKVTFEDNEDVYREIDIKSAQHFEDFHNAIIESIGFDNKHNASFFISDDYWRKGDEIMLHPIEKEDAGLKNREVTSPKKQMNKCKLLSLIDDPHQKFVYVYDPKVEWTFNIELMKIVPENEKIKYPNVTKNVGEAPKQYIANTSAVVVDEDEMEDEDEKAKLIDSVAYASGADDEDTALLESIEGEDETTEEEEDMMSNEFEAEGEEESSSENFEED